MSVLKNRVSPGMEPTCPHSHAALPIKVQCEGTSIAYLTASREISEKNWQCGRGLGGGSVCHAQSPFAVAMSWHCQDSANVMQGTCSMNMA